VTLVEDNDMVETLATDGTDQAFRVQILPGRMRRTYDLLDAHARYTPLECLAINAIPIANQEARSLVEGESFNNLLRGPLRCWMGRDVEENNMSSILAKHNAR